MSRYDVLARRTTPPIAESSPLADTPTSPEKTGTTTGARRGNPSYRQFSAYVPLELYRKLKVKLAERDSDLSEAVEEAIADWIAKKTP